MRKHRAIVALCSMTLVLTMLLTGFPAGMAAQDTPIEPVDTGDETGQETQEIVVAGQRYLRDLDVPVDPNPLQQVTDDTGATAYVKPEASDPLGAVYVPLDDGSGLMTRYYPQYVGVSDATCPVDQAGAGTLSGDGATYLSAGPELDYTVATLQEAGATGDGATIYRIPGDDSLQNLFVAQNSGQGPNSLVRYVLISDTGAPATLADGFTFAGQQFTVAPGAIGSLDGLLRVGCAGLFPLFASTPDQPFTTVALDVAGQAVSFAAAPPEQPVATPPELPATPESTPVPGTPEPTLDPNVPLPTTEPTPEPTLEPTAEPTLEPTAEPTVEPTTEPTPEPTQEPTVEPTPEPTVEPTAEPTLEPTAEPTPEPTAEPSPEPTAEPTTEPTAAPTSASTAEPTTAPDAGLGEEPEALPTEAPPTPGPGTPEPTPPTPRPTPTPRPLQPQAIVPTLPPDVPSPPSGQTDVISCAGIVGELDDNGVPERLPRNIQYGGDAYRYSGQVATADAGDVAATGCVGPFVLYLPAEGSDDTRLYLGLMNSGQTLFAFDQTTSLSVRTQSPADQQPRSLELGPTEDQPAVRYRAGEPWQPSIYSSLSLEIYVEDPEAGMPSRFLGHSVGFDAFGEYAVQGGAEGASQEVVQRAEGLGIHPEVIIEGQRYVLVALWTPFGTTTNGWLTLYSIDGESTPQRLVGLDPRRQDLLVFTAEQ